MLQDQKRLSLKPDEQWWLHLLEEGSLPDADPENPRRAPSDELFAQAKKLIPDLKYQGPHLLGRILRKYGCIGVRVDKRRGWEFPLLKEARAAWMLEIGDNNSHWGEQDDWEHVEKANFFP